MQNELIIRRSPIVLIGKFAAVEAVGFILYFIATLFGGTKYEIYTQLSLSNFLLYQVAKILFLTIAQFALTVYAFLSWYYEENTSYVQELFCIRRACFGRRKNRSPLTNIQNLPLSRASSEDYFAADPCARRTGKVLLYFRPFPCRNGS